MSLDMLGHIDDVFKSVPAQRTAKAGGYDTDGIWQDATSTATPHTVNIQPLSEKEIDNLVKGGKRIVDARKIFVNDGDTYNLKPSDTWTFTGIDGTFKQFKTDNRPWRNYCKCIVYKEDS